MSRRRSGKALSAREITRAGRTAQFLATPGQWIASLEAIEREQTGVKSLKIGYNKVFGYYIEVTRANLENQTDEYARTKTGATQ